MCSGIARGRVRTTATTTTAESRNMAAIRQILGWERHAALVYRVLLWYWISMLWSIITHPLIFEWFYWLLYVTWYKFSGQLSRNNPRPSRYLSSDCSVEEKHSQHKNFNFSFVLFSMEGNQTSVIKSSDGDIKKLMGSAVPESTKRSLKYAV